jgi:hypothetical protein
MSKTITYKDFNDLFNQNKTSIYEISNKIEEPNKEKMIKLFNEYVLMIYNNIAILKPQNNLPKIDENFIIYIKLNLNSDINYKHCPMHYTTEDGKNSMIYASPEIITNTWVDFKISKLWYDKLIKLGYTLE